MKLTIAGTPGSGKSTLSRMLAEELDLRKVSIGDMRREMAKERNMTLAELNELAEEEDWSDKKVDEFQKQFGEENDDFIMESRLGWHFIPDSIKIFLDADAEARAERMLGRTNEEESFDTVEEVIEANEERIESDDKRYTKYYGIEKAFDPSHFDIVLDSTNNNPKEVLEEAVREIEEYRKA